MRASDLIAFQRGNVIVPRFVLMYMYRENIQELGELLEYVIEDDRKIKDRSN